VENLSIESYVATLNMEQSGALSATQAKTVLGEILANGGEPALIAQSKGFERLASGALGEVVAQLIEENPTSGRATAPVTRNWPSSSSDR